MENRQVFNSGSVKTSLEQESNFSALRKKASGPAIDNSLTSKFAAIDFGKIKRIFRKEYRVPTIEVSIERLDGGDHDGTIDMDSIINSALAKHEKRIQQNFLFDRIRAISSETKRIYANIELGDSSN